MPDVMRATQSVLHALMMVLDLGGTLVFAMSGGLVAIQRRLDLFGVLVLSFAAGNAGGIGRDLLIGAVPPAAIADWKYLGVSALAALITLFCFPRRARIRDDVVWFDAVGLAFFAISGTQKALLHGIHPVMAAFLGMLTGVGGGMVRDLLVTQTPVVLRADLYASAALAGAVVVVSARLLHLSSVAAAIAGGVLCFALRCGAILFGWHLPRAAGATPARDSPDAARDRPQP
jgi:uncharacterized membrane protein YeiH